MAKTIASIGGVGLVPGVSRNRRWYTPEHLAGAVTAAQERLAAGDRPMVMLTHHDANDDSTRIAAALRSVTLAGDGSVRWSADVPDTAAGREIAALADTSDGKPAFLDGVSIRGRWLGRVRKVTAPDGQHAEQGEGLEIEGLDFTHKPGVPGARIDTFAWARDGAAETTERVPITESVQEARVTITEDTAPSVPGGLLEVVRSVIGAAVTEAGTPPLSKRGAGLKSGDGQRSYADPGYQRDKKQRYDLTTKAHAKSAWSFISKPANAKLYTGPQLKQVKSRIIAALKKFGVTVAAEGWSIDPAILITEQLAEYAGMDPECAGSYSLSATNGPTTVTVCSYGLDPADLHVILAQACAAASAALCSIDPDMDGDIDVPGAEAEDADGDVAPGAVLPDNGDGVDPLVARIVAAIRGESAEDPAAIVAEAMTARNAAEAAPDPAPEPAAATQEMEAPVTETTTTEAAGQVTAATFTQSDLDAAVQRGIAAAEEARRARKAAKRAVAPAESAPAAPAVTEAADIDRIISEKVAAAFAAKEQPAAPAVTETLEQQVERRVAEAVTAAKQQLTESGQGPSRKGLAVTEHAGAKAPEPGLNSHGFPSDWPDKPAHQFTDEERQQYFGPALVRHTLGAKADLLG